MTSLLRSLMRPASRSYSWPLSSETMTFGGVTYPLGMGYSSNLSFKQEDIGYGFASYATQMMMANPIVFALCEYRRKTFSQAHFQWQRLRAGTAGPAGEFFGTPALAPLESRTPDLLSTIIQYADLAGSAMVVDRGGRYTVLRPDWTSIIAASVDEPSLGSAAIDARIMGYAYWPGGKGYGEPEILLPEEVALFAPIPDPLARWRGMSWMTPAIRDVMGDAAATQHKLKYFENGGGAGIVVKMDPAIVNTLDKFKAWTETLEQGHKGAANAYKTWYLSAAVDVTTVGDNLRQQDFKVTQGAGESRIAADAGVPPVLVGFSEGLASATYSNYGLARRSYIDSTLWDLWGNLCGALETILPPPPGCRLWVDGRRIPLLQEDEKDRAETQAMDASAINTLVTAGYDPDSVVSAVTSGDLTRLIHSGLYSVQLQPAGAQAEEPARARQVTQARQRLIESGIARPTVAQVADELGVSERTAQRWQTA